MEQETTTRVTPISAPSEMTAIKEQCKGALDRWKTTFRVCAGTACIAGGSLDVYEELKNQIKQRGIDVDVELLDDGSAGVRELGPPAGDDAPSSGDRLGADDDSESGSSSSERDRGGDDDPDDDHGSSDS